MRVGDVYKIRTMIGLGATEEEILKRFKYEYPEEEIRKFIPKPKAEEKPKRMRNEKGHFVKKDDGNGS